jgi:hypothetical protein
LLAGESVTLAKRLWKEKGGMEMTRIELTEKEAAMLSEILESFLSDLKTERVHTDNRELHAEFIEREIFVGDLIKRLQGEK